MNPLLSFEEYLKAGIVRKQHSDSSRANFLIEEAKKSFLGLKQRIEKIEVNEFNASSIVKEAHDIILELILAKMLIDCFSSSGTHAHESEIAYMNILGFSKIEVEFMNELRYLRNGILYYGTRINKEYAEKVLNFLDKVYPILKKKLGLK